MSEIDTLMKDTAASGGNIKTKELLGAEAMPPKASDTVATKAVKNAPAQPKVTLQMAIDAATQNLEVESTRKKKSQSVRNQSESSVTDVAAVKSEGVPNGALRTGVVKNSPQISKDTISFSEALLTNGDSLDKKTEDSLAAVKEVENQMIAVAEKSVPNSKEGVELRETIYSQIWFVPMMFALFFFLGLMYSNQKKSLQGEIKELFRLNRTNFSTSNVKSSLSRFVLTLLSLLSVSLFMYLTYTEMFNVQAKSHFMSLAVTFGLVAAFFVLKDMMSSLLGYVFFDKEHTVVWMKSYNLILVLLGMALFPIDLCVSFGPASVAEIAIWAGFVMVLISVLLFLYKLNMLFFSGAFSIFYLILYLCTLEILPVFALVFGVGNLIE